MTFLRGVRPVADLSTAARVAVTSLRVPRVAYGRIRVPRLPQLDWVLLLAVATLIGLGAVLVYSATRHDAALTGGDPAAFLRRHLLNAAIGLLLAAMVTAVEWRTLRAYAALLYGGALLGLLAVLGPLGSTVNGSRSWISLPAGFSVQPAELAKVALVLALAVILGRSRDEGARHAGDPLAPGPPSRQSTWTGLLVLGVPMALVAVQPDLGTVTVLGAIGISVLVVSGVRARWLLALLAAGGAAVALGLRLGLLRDYQIARFAAFTDPSLDPLGVGYNTGQARLAIESGGWWGAGLFDGALTRASRVPERHTDFIFTVAGEELGFAGGALLIGLFGVLLWRCLRIGAQAYDLPARLVAAGVTGWFAFQAFQNIGMTLGIMPVTGLPLPFVSYGGSSMFASLLAVGLLQSISRGRARAVPHPRLAPHPHDHDDRAVLQHR